MLRHDVEAQLVCDVEEAAANCLPVGSCPLPVGNLLLFCCCQLLFNDVDRWPTLSSHCKLTLNFEPSCRLMMPAELALDVVDVDCC